MTSSHTIHVAERAKAIYSQRLQTELEAAHPNGYVAIEPESGEHFLADSFGRAVAAARAAHPDRISFVIHIGHSAAIPFGRADHLNGRVDESLRALMDVAVRRTESETPKVLTVWIDTAFNGFLVFPQKLIEELGLQQEAATEAILADGSLVTLESFTCYVEWFGKILPAQVIGNNGKLPLLGTELLAKRKLLIDYINGVVSIS